MTSQHNSPAVPFWEPIARLFWTSKSVLGDSKIQPFFALYFQLPPTQSETQAVRIGIAINHADYFGYFSGLYPVAQQKHIMLSRMYQDEALIPGIPKLTLDSQPYFGPQVHERRIAPMKRGPAICTVTDVTAKPFLSAKLPKFGTNA